MPTRLLIASRVVSIAAIADDVKLVRLAPQHRDRFPAFASGDHIQLQLRDGLRREYSLCGPLECTETYEIAVLREPDGRVAVHTRCPDYRRHCLRLLPAIRDSYRVRGQRNLFIAGGIGITATVSLLRALPPGADAEVHYCVRSRSRTPLLDELHELGATVHLYVSDEDERLDVQSLLAGPTDGTHLYHCGPERLRRAIDAATVRWPPGTMHTAVRHPADYR
ncbi:MAG: ferredoxin reductase [Gemmatimonadaceae bacterium]